MRNTRNVLGPGGPSVQGTALAGKSGKTLLTKWGENLDLEKDKESTSQNVWG